MSERKKWCEVCKMLIPYTRAAIQDHENTFKHKKNKDKDLLNQNKKSRMERKQQNKAYDSLPATYQRDHKKKEDHNYHQKTEQQYTGENEKQEKQVADQMAFFAEGKIWILEKEDDTGKLRFRNTITGGVQYERPLGLLLEDYEEEAWEEYQQNPQPVDKEMVVKIGQWEVVNQDEAFLNKYKVETSSSEEEEADHVDQLADKVEEGIKNHTINTQQQLVKEILTFGEIGKDKNRILQQKLLELAEKDVELKDVLPQVQKQHEQVNTAGMFAKKSFKKTKVDYINF